MTFINEFISDEDMKKYKIKSIDDQFKFGNTNSDSWTIDKKNNMFLKKLAKDRIDDYGRIWVYWIFLWEGNLFVITTENVDSNHAKRGQFYWLHKKIRKLAFFEKDLPLNNALQTKLLKSLRKAFMVYADGGVYSDGGGFDMKLEIDLI